MPLWHKELKSKPTILISDGMDYFGLGIFWGKTDGADPLPGMRKADFGHRNHMSALARHVHF